MEKKIETKKYPGLSYEVHDFLLEKPIKWHSVEDLCKKFFGNYNSTLDKEMRSIIRDISFDRMFQKIIISGVRGYKVAENNDEIESFLEKSLSTAKSFFERYSAVKYKYRKDDQCKLKIGQHDSDFFEAMIKSESIGQVAFNI